MEDVQPAGPVHDKFVAWAKACGVSIGAISPAQIPQHGLGMVATDPIEVGTELVSVPTKALLTTDRIPEAYAAKHLGNISVHGLLASYLANASTSGAASEFGPWMNTWPTFQDFQTYIPLLWPPQLFRQSPSSNSAEKTWAIPCAIEGLQGQWDYTSKPARKVPKSESLVAKQRRKLQADYEAARLAFPDMDEATFTHKWLVVNTRSFYWDFPLRLAPRSNEDKMILCPLIDYFNHADKGCVVQYDSNGYSVIADRNYEPGEELFVCYGAHNSDLLLAEYGFVPQTNCHDTLSLDAFVLAPETEIECSHGRRLKKHKYLDGYNLVKSSDGWEACHRTQVAVRTATTRPAEWLNFVRHGRSSEEQDRNAAAFLEERVIERFRAIARDSLALVNNDVHPLWGAPWWIVEGLDWEQRRKHIRGTLRHRWEQILEMLTSTKHAHLEIGTR